MLKCENIGVSATTDVVIKKHSDSHYEARCGISLIGITNMTDDEFQRCNKNPFHTDFYDNYASGTGETENKAIDAMKVNLKSIADSFWI